MLLMTRCGVRLLRHFCSIITEQKIRRNCWARAKSLRDHMISATTNTLSAGTHFTVARLSVVRCVANTFAARHPIIPIYVVARSGIEIRKSLSVSRETTSPHWPALVFCFSRLFPICVCSLVYCSCVCVCVLQWGWLCLVCRFVKHFITNTFGNFHKTQHRIIKEIQPARDVRTKKIPYVNRSARWPIVGSVISNDRRARSRSQMYQIWDICRRICLAGYCQFRIHANERKRKYPCHLIAYAAVTHKLLL